MRAKLVNEAIKHLSGRTDDNSLLLYRVRELYTLENDILDFYQIMEFDSPGEEIAEILNRPEIATMPRNQIYKNKEIRKAVEQILSKRNKEIQEQIKNVEDQILLRYPLLKNAQEQISEDDSIFKASSVYKNGKTWTIVTPSYYHDDCKLSTEEVNELKRFIKDKKKPIKKI